MFAKKYGILDAVAAMIVKSNFELFFICCSFGHVLKDWVLSAFEYQSAGCYNIPFTGLTLIQLVKTYYTYITEYYPVWKKFVNFNSERVS
jgi:hypothetical protein